jgi:hypothetical protein
MHVPCVSLIASIERSYQLRSTRCEPKRITYAQNLPCRPNASKLHSKQRRLKPRTSCTEVGKKFRGNHHLTRELSSSQAALLLAKIELSSSAAAEPIEKVEEPGDPKCDSLVAHPMPHFMPLKKAGPFARFAPALSSPKTAGVAQGHLARTCHGRWPFYSRRCFFCELPIFRSCSG